MGKVSYYLEKKNTYEWITINSRILNLIRKESYCCKGRNKFKFTTASRWRDIAKVIIYPTMVTRIFSLALSFRARYFHALPQIPRTLEGDSPSNRATRCDAESLVSNFSVMRFPGERRGITARRDFLLVSLARASPRSHTSNCRPGVLQVHMIRSAPLSAFITYDHGNAYRRSREIFPRTFHAFRELTSTLFYLCLFLTQTDLTWS